VFSAPWTYHKWFDGVLSKLARFQGDLRRRRGINTIIAVKKKLTRATVGLLLLPVCYGVLRSLWALVLGFEQVPEGSFYFILGFAGYLVFQWVFFKPMRSYVFGHELTHAIAAWLTGGEVHAINVSKKGGSVTVSKPNIVVALAPYVVPFYSLILLGLYFAVNHFYSLTPYWDYALGLLGASVAFHMALTIYALKQDQPDLKTGGQFLSGIFIFLGNALVLVFLLGVMFPKTVSWGMFLRGTKTHTVLLCQRIGEGSSYIWTYGQNYLHGHIQPGNKT
jgi:hypothetical protein